LLCGNILAPCRSATGEHHRVGRVNPGEAPSATEQVRGVDRRHSRWGSEQRVIKDGAAVGRNITGDVAGGSTDRHRVGSHNGARSVLEVDSALAEQAGGDTDKG